MASVQMNTLEEEDIAVARAVGVLPSKTSDWYLTRNEEGFLCLGTSLLPEIKPISIDFCSGKSIFKRNSIHIKNQPLRKATSFRQKGDRLLDLTAGFGEDAMMFASMGFQVHSLERQPLIFLLLQDALERLQLFDETDAIVAENRLHFHFVDAKDFVASIGNERFECVYYDPMFDISGKTALSSGRMQILQKLTGYKEMLNEKLIDHLLNQPFFDRLVVKMALKAQPLLPRPVHSYRGKAVRYDLYKP